MAKMKKDSFVDLSWDDLREWAGSKIVSRGKSYQRQKLVSKLAVLDNGGLLAWVDGTYRYATQVTLDKDGLPESTCTCPYGCDCKHGVAVVLEYLEQIKKNKKIPKAAKDDERLMLFEDYGWDDNIYDNDDDDDYYIEQSQITKKLSAEIITFLKDKTKAQLTELILELAEKFPKIAQELTDRKQLASGEVKSLINRLKKQIREISSEPGWQNYWEHEGYTPDYAEIRIKLETLFKAGHADEVLTLGKDLIERGNRQIEESHDDGETAMETEECMPVIVKALEQSSMSKPDKLAWAVEVVLKDDYDVFNAFDDYLGKRHAKADWNNLADKLLKKLNRMKSSDSQNDFHQNYARDRLTNWILYALEQAGRDGEIIPLCEVEARKTGSYTRLVKYLIAEKRYGDAEHWIQEGIDKTKKDLPGIASDLRNRLKEIRTSQKDWIAVATMQTEEFIRHPSTQTYTECKKANIKTKAWPIVQEYLLDYLEKGKLPWKQKDWPLAKSNQVVPDRLYRNTFPMTDVLIGIAILEKQPDRVLFWYDQSQKNKRGWVGMGDDRIATAVQDYAPERSIEIWKTIAEGLINQTKPRAYEQAASYLRRAEKIMKRQKKLSDWKKYLRGLREKHARKRRFIEILDQSDGKPIISKK
ncbi:MAG: SWIM zinc finger domain-containing protein [Sedimentisphaerales bacterium]|nr:SWIM zinc finger domain-containing protein [Sedimentisphaerales bacterium]